MNILSVLQISAHVLINVLWNVWFSKSNKQRLVSARIMSAPLATRHDSFDNVSYRLVSYARSWVANIGARFTLTHNCLDVNKLAVRFGTLYVCALCNILRLTKFGSFFLSILLNRVIFLLLNLIILLLLNRTVFLPMLSDFPCYYCKVDLY